VEVPAGRDLDIVAQAILLGEARERLRDRMKATDRPVLDEVAAEHLGAEAPITGSSPPSLRLRLSHHFLHNSDGH
jgi:hypothetical protein